MNKDLIKKLEKTGRSVHVGYMENIPRFVVPTGSLKFDVLTFNGGYQSGHISQVAGAESSGKTTLALRSIAGAQKLGMRCAYVDSEYTLSKERVASLGVNTDDLLMVKSNVIEEVGDAILEIANSGEYQFIVLDSIGSLTAKTIEEGEIDMAAVGVRAKRLSMILLKLLAPISLNNVSVLFINQLRDNVGAGQWDEDYIIPGGRALQYHSSLIALLDKKLINEEKKKEEEIEGDINVRVRLKKNKLGPAYKSTSFVLSPDGKVDIEAEIADILTSPFYSKVLGVTGAGAWYTFDEEVYGKPLKLQGKGAITKALKDDPEFREISYKVILSNLTSRKM